MANIPLEFYKEARAAVTILVINGCSPPEDNYDYDQNYDECSEESFAWQGEVSDGHLCSMLGKKEYTNHC